MGDIILTTPIIRCVKEQTGADIHVLVKPVFSPLVDHHPGVNKIWHFEKENIESITNKLREEKFDMVIDLQKNRRSKKLSQSLRAEVITFNKENIRKWILVQSNIDLLPKVHLVERYFIALQRVNITNDNKGCEIYIPNKEKSEVTRLGLPEKYVVIGVGAQHQGKCILYDQLLKLIDSIPTKVVLLGGESEMIIAEKLVANSKQKPIDLTGKTSLLASAEITGKAKVVISGDTGLMHMASAFNIPQVSVWGCTSPDFGMYPYLPHPDSLILEPSTHSKRPCSKLGNECKYAPNYCIEGVSAKRISESVLSIFQKQSL